MRFLLCSSDEEREKNVQTTYLNFNICSLTLSTTQRLVNHDAAIGKSTALTLCTGSQQECSHRGGHSKAAVCRFDWMRKEI